MMSVIVSEIINEAQALLQVTQFKDYAPNGLQIEGQLNVHKIVTGVTASQALIRRAIEAQAQLLLVHHGYFWDGEDPRVIGMKKQRIALLLEHQINLAAYHLPLDAHATLGNHVQLGKKLGLNITGFTGKFNMVAVGELPYAMDAHAFSNHVAHALTRIPLVVGDPNKIIKTIAWCTGAAQSYMQLAQEAGVDAYLSGEISEQTTHFAIENNMVYFAAGHHATERYGIQALGEYLAVKFDIKHEFIDVDNPV